MGRSMIAVVQRVKECTMQCVGYQTQLINHGILVFLGIESGDQNQDIKYMIQKLLKLRIFNDDSKKMSLSVSDIQGEIMIISQFTLCGDTTKGNRPSYIKAMEASKAKLIYNNFIDEISTIYSKIKSGVFQGNMQINLINDGPVTLILRSNK